MTKRTLFHIAFSVDDLTKAREFYGRVLGCKEGRSTDQWIDFSLFGHQIVAHLQPLGNRKQTSQSHVDGQKVPIPHFGVVLEWRTYQRFVTRLKKAKVKFGVEPHIRFEGQAGEQATTFFYDPAGNALEFKAFKDIEQLFAKRPPTYTTAKKRRRAPA